MRAVILSVGSELLRGDIVDTNAAFLARELSTLGFEVGRVEAAPDVLDRLTDTVRRSLADATVTVCTGGLGPTHDDLTREAIAAVLGEELYVDEDLFRQIESRFALLRRRMPASNRRQAMLIRSARAVPNPNGTAPGWLVERDGRTIVTMPGPPKEMQPMWRDSVVPHLQSLLPGETAMLALMTFGLGESAVEERIADVIHRRDDVTVATYAKDAGVQVHVTVRAATAETAQHVLAETEAQLRQRLGEAIYGAGEATLSSAVGRFLADRSLTLAVMESASGGELASLITETPGSSDYFLGGVVAYSRAVKEGFGVPSEIMDRHGLISAETARSMASAVRSRLGSDVGIGVTGIAGAEAIEDRPPGTCFVAVSMDGVEEAREIHRPASREIAKRFFAQSALDLLRRHLSVPEGTPA